MSTTVEQLKLGLIQSPEAPEEPKDGAHLADPVKWTLTRFPRLRFMGSKYRLIPWIHETFSELPFETALDTFSGSGVVAYLLKAMGKRVITNDFLKFPAVIAKATVENASTRLPESTLERLLDAPSPPSRFIEETFKGVFFTEDDLRFLDRTWHAINALPDATERHIALAALIRSCVKRQPRGVFTVAGDPSHYKDGRRDLKLSLREHFVEQVRVYNDAVFDNGKQNLALCGDVFDLESVSADLVYLDPPYVPRSDDNCYVKRYHFLEGLVDYWATEPVRYDTRVRKIPKKFTPFSYRRTAEAAFDRLFGMFPGSILVLSYSSNGFPDLERLVDLMKRHRREIVVKRHDHRYHFGTHEKVKRARVEEYLIVGLP